MVGFSNSRVASTFQPTKIRITHFAFHSCSYPRSYSRRLVTQTSQHLPTTFTTHPPRMALILIVHAGSCRDINIILLLYISSHKVFSRIREAVRDSASRCGERCYAIWEYVEELVDWCKGRIGITLKCRNCAGRFVISHCSGVEDGLLRRPGF